ncbi:MAG: hypothetical protein OXG56_01745 [Gammaproteobacteria bacterium]|nr:hypothetical protein [Gammaproteobacteria bacterium]
MATRNRTIFRREALIRNAQPETLDDLLRVTAPRERIFRTALLALLLVLVVWGVFVA